LVILTVKIYRFKVPHTTIGFMNEGGWAKFCTWTTHRDTAILFPLKDKPFSNF